MQKLRGMVLIPLSVACLFGQVGRVADWLTHGGDPQRTGWQKFEKTITPESVKGFQLLWKLKLENEQKAMYSIFEPLIMGRLITNRGFKEMAFVAGSSDNIFAVDADLGRILWQRHFDHAAGVPQTANPTWLCPGGLTATPVIPPPPTFGGRGGAPAPASAGRGPAPQTGPAPSAPTPGRREGDHLLNRQVVSLTQDVGADRSQRTTEAMSRHQDSLGRPRIQ
jgi:hypothetical protein